MQAAVCITVAGLKYNEDALTRRVNSAKQTIKVALAVST